MTPDIQLRHAARPIDLDRIIDVNAPLDWRERYGNPQQLEVLLQKSPIEVVVLVADIRRSNQVQRDSRDFLAYAATMGHFLGTAIDAFRGAGMWFDRTTGDGFIAYSLQTSVWSWAGEALEQRTATPPNLSMLLGLAGGLHAAFKEGTGPAFERLCQHVPKEFGLALGIDGGLADFAEMAGDLAVVGPPIAGATRMADVARAGETLLNNYIGFVTHEAEWVPDGVTITRETRATSDFPEGQVVYSLVGQPADLAKSHGARRNPAT
jgi:class 3 adenylate cyclase